jgi:hypothetical protein
MIGIVIGKIKSGTVNWLKRASAAKTLLELNSMPSFVSCVYVKNVTTVIRILEMCVKKAGSDKIES